MTLTAIPVTPGTTAHIWACGEMLTCVVVVPATAGAAPSSAAVPNITMTAGVTRDFLIRTSCSVRT